ncbi:MAG: hypothetical protein IJL02_07130 [Methanobrevibacter sp.]|uniref:hypothetical protein n=1 Tax=Methanobrevibacter sp. TaxID=66852 RepID=UPI0025E4AED7|nr:hypothetical protein [Methanobrevibacter sp.]MBQ6099619.1 hypothetical protein [Methanobrevibacter sp.]
MIQKFQKAERVFVPSDESKLTTQNLEEFILNNFRVPDDDLGRISRFIASDLDLKKIIFDLPGLIKTEFAFEKLEIKFYDEFQEDELMLVIGIFTSGDIESSLIKEEKLERKLYQLYNKSSADKLLLIVECK